MAVDPMFLKWWNQQGFGMPDPAAGIDLRYACYKRIAAEGFAAGRESMRRGRPHDVEDLYQDTEPIYCEPEAGDGP